MVAQYEEGKYPLQSLTDEKKATNQNSRRLKD